MSVKSRFMKGFREGAGLAQLSDAPAQTEALRGVTSIPGWSRIDGRAASLWLPDSWYGGDPRADLSRLAERAKALGPDFLGELRALELSPIAANLTKALIAMDSENRSTFVMVLAERLSLLRRGMTVEQYLKTGIARLPKNIHPLNHGVTLLDDVEAGWMVFENCQKRVFGKGGPVVDKGLQYCIKGDGVFWDITYKTAPDEYEARQPLFEQSARTFRF